MRKQFVAQAQPQYYEQVQHQPQQNFDYRKFLDFGFFANTAAGFGGPHQAAPNTQTYTVQKSHVPDTVTYEKRVVTSVVPQQEVLISASRIGEITE